MSQSNLASMADYADALITARRARNWLFWLLLVMLLAQIGIFLTLRFTSLLARSNAADVSWNVALAVDGMHAATVAIGFLSIVLALVLCAVLGLILVVMLVGRTVGVSRVTSAFVWSLVLAALVFPWQSLLDAGVRSQPVLTVRVKSPAQAAPATTATMAPTTAQAAVPAPSGAVTAEASVQPCQPAPVVRIPGVIQTWEDLQADANATWVGPPQLILKWSRYVVFPLVAVLLLAMVQTSSGRGLKLALGETDPTGPESASA